MNTRSFFVYVNPKLLPYTMDPVRKTGFVNVKTKEGYNLSYKKGVVPSLDDIQLAVTALNTKVMAIIDREIKMLMQYWQRSIRAFFNRTKRRSNTKSRLAGALRVESMNSFGARFYVMPCYNMGVDYVDVLVKGAGPTIGNHYSPKYNARLPGGVWGGIPTTYWANWQRRFQNQIEISQKRLDREIRTLISSFKSTKHGNILYGSANTADKNLAKKKEVALYKKQIDSKEGSSNYAKFFSDQKKSDVKTITTAQSRTSQSRMNTPQSRAPSMRSAAPNIRSVAFRR